MHISNRVFGTKGLGKNCQWQRYMRAHSQSFNQEAMNYVEIRNCSDCAKLMGSEKEEFIELGELNS